MAVHGLSDVTATVTVPKHEYEDLIRENERFSVAKRMMESMKDYEDVGIIKTMLGIKGREANEEEIIMHDTDGDIHKFGNVEGC